MSLAITHFSVGVCSVVGFLYLTQKQQSDFRLLYLFGGGLFAMIPDMSKLVGGSYPIVESSLMNIFFFHNGLDLIDETNSIVIAGLAILCMCVSIVFLTAHTADI
jgi:hypothetical protein